MSDAATSAVCVATGVAALLAVDVPVWMLTAVALLFLVCRNAFLLAVLCAAYASSSASAAWQSLDQPLEFQSGIATVVRDPEYKYGAQRAHVSIDGRRYELIAYDAAAAALRPMMAGQRVLVDGAVKPLSGKVAPSLRRKHIAGTVTAKSVEFHDSGNTLARSTNAVRSELTETMSHLPGDHRTLALGVTIGDDRAMTAEVREHFEQANLLHLTAVSGANVAFLLLIFAPLLMRLSLAGRLIGGTALLFVFGVVTRWEPSVVRAEAMALMVLVASFAGRPISLIRALALGSTAAMLIDPLLAGSIGFLLSVSACLGMALLAPRLAAVLPGPSALRYGIAYAVAAQIGVAPIQLVIFGPIPVAGVVANLVAAPLAGALMFSAVVGAALVSVTGPAIASLLLLPAQVCAGTLLWIADTAAASNWGSWTIVRAVLATAAVAVITVVTKTATFKVRERSATRLPHQG